MDSRAGKPRAAEYLARLRASVRRDGLPTFRTLLGWRLFLLLAETALEAKPRDVCAIARQLGCSRRHAGRLLGDLRDDGWVRLERDAADGRRTVAVPTARLRRAMRHIL